MATPGKLIETVADVLNLPEVTVASCYRNLREAGLVSKGGRGRSAAKMVPQDAANLLIAVAASSMVKEAVDIVGDYSALRPDDGELWVPRDRGHESIRNNSGEWDLRLMPIAVLKALPTDHTFVQALAGLIEAASDGSLEEAIKNTPADKYGLDVKIPNFNINVRFFSPFPQIMVLIQTRSFRETKYYRNTIPIDRDGMKQWEKECCLKYGDGDLQQTREFSARTIFTMGKMLKN